MGNQNVALNILFHLRLKSRKFGEVAQELHANLPRGIRKNREILTLNPIFAPLEAFPKLSQKT